MTDKYQALREALEDGSASGSWKDRRAIRALLRDHDEWRLQAQYETDVAQAAIEQVKKLEAERDALREALKAMLEIHGVTQSYAETHIEIPKSWVEVSDLARAALSQGEKA